MFFCILVRFSYEMVYLRQLQFEQNEKIALKTSLIKANGIIYRRSSSIISSADLPRVSGMQTYANIPKMTQKPANVKRQVASPYDAWAIGNEEPSTKKQSHIVAVKSAKEVGRIWKWHQCYTIAIIILRMQVHCTHLCRIYFDGKDEWNWHHPHTSRESDEGQAQRWHPLQPRRMRVKCTINAEYDI